jgi:hypothetical protein
LTAQVLAAKGQTMTRTPLLIMLVSAAALAGCNKQSHTIVAGNEIPEDANVAAATGPVELPPSIVASKVYRCADNNIVYVNWMSDEKSATIRVDHSGTPTKVEAPAAGQPMTGPGGFSLSGSHSASSAKIGIPGHPAQSCKG